MGITKAGNLIGTPSGIWYSMNGGGKTHFLSTAFEVPALQPSIIIEGEPEGCSTIKKLYPDMDIFEFDWGKDINKQWDGMLKDIQKFKPRFIAYDGISYSMNKIVYELSGGHKPSFNHWQTLFVVTEKLIEDLKAITPHLHVSALPSWIKNGEGDIVGVQPLLKGQDFPKNFNSIFNILGYLDMKVQKGPPSTGAKVTRTLRVLADAYSVVRARVDIRENIPEPTMEKLYSVLAKAEDKSIEEYVLSKWKEGSGQISK